MIEQDEFTIENMDGYSDAAGRKLKRSTIKRAPSLKKKPVRKIALRKSAVKAGQGRGSAPVSTGQVSERAPVKAGHGRGSKKSDVSKPVAKPVAVRNPAKKAPVKRAPVSMPAPAEVPKIQSASSVSPIKKPATSPVRQVAAAPVRKSVAAAVAPVRRAIPVKKSLNPIIENQKITIPAKGDYVEQQPVLQHPSPVKRIVETPTAKSAGGVTGLKVITKNDIIIEGDEKYDSAEGKPKSNLTKIIIGAAVIGVAIFMFKFIK